MIYSHWHHVLCLQVSSYFSEKDPPNDLGLKFHKVWTCFCLSLAPPCTLLGTNSLLAILHDKMKPEDCRALDHFSFSGHFGHAKWSHEPSCPPSTNRPGSHSLGPQAAPVLAIQCTANEYFRSWSNFSFICHSIHVFILLTLSPPRNPKQRKR